MNEEIYWHTRQGEIIREQNNPKNWFKFKYQKELQKEFDELHKKIMGSQS